ncbi:MAG: acetyl-CoA C-acyltransferase [Micavibrio sp.]|nr:acetyl-CoA C-acyltransferase [Micavibrio sp.]
MFTSEVLLAAPVRTAIGAYNGSFKQTPVVELGAAVIRETVRRAGIDVAAIGGVVMGNVIQAGNKMNPARQAAIHGGLSVDTPALTVNRVCGSGAQAIVSAAQDVALGATHAAVAGGMENMDLAPYLMAGGRWGYRMGDAYIYDSMLRDGLHDAFSDKHSGWHTEDLISQYAISRELQDNWAFRSQQRFARAQENGDFTSEIVAVNVPAKTGATVFDKDEANRPDTSLDKLTKLKAVFRQDGTLTAGNSPGLNSGAASLLVMTRKFANEYSVKPLARLKAYAVSAVAPELFGIAPAPAIRSVLERAGWKLSEVERFEINEAYAAVPLAVMKELMTAG